MPDKGSRWKTVHVFIEIIAYIVGIYTMVEFAHNKFSFVTVSGTVKYKIQAKERIGYRSIIRLEDKLDQTDDKGVFKIERVKAEKNKLLSMTLFADGKFIHSQKRVDIERPSFWNQNVRLGEIVFEPSEIAVPQKNKVELNGKITYMQIDKKNLGVPDATVYIAEKGLVTKTDSEGNYCSEFPPGDYYLLIVGSEKRSFHEHDISHLTQTTVIDINNFPRNFGAAKGVVKDRSGVRPAKGVFINIGNKHFGMTNEKGEYFIDNIPFNQKHERYTFIARRGLNEIQYTSEIRIDSYDIIKKNILSFPPRTAIAAQIEELAGIGAMPKRISSRYPSTVDKVFAWTDTSDIPGEKITHNWFFQDKEVNSASLAISPPFKAYSETKIFPSQKGSWRVEVLGEDGRLIDTMKFKIR